jgi:ATP-binding cassette subfamily C protein
MRDVLRKLRYLLSAQEQRTSLILFVLLALGAVLEMVSLSAIPAFVALLSDPSRLITRLPAPIARAIHPKVSDATLVLYGAVGLLMISVVKNALIALVTHRQNRFISDRQISLAHRLFGAYLTARYPFHLNRNTAELLRNANDAASNVVNCSILPLFHLCLDGLTIVVLMGLLVAREPLTSVVALSLLGGSTYVFIRAIRGRMSAYGDEMYERRIDVIRTVNEGLGGIKITKVFGREGYFADEFKRHMTRYSRAMLRRATAADLPRLYLETVAVLGLLAVATLLLLQGRPPAELLPVLTLFGVAVVRMVPSFNRATGAVTALRFGQQDLNAVYEDLRQLEAAPQHRPKHIGESPRLSFSRLIEFEGVGFQYPGTRAPALRNVSLRIQRGTAIGFVGPTGSGKTTLVDVILGLLRPTEGRVLVDGVDVHADIRAWQDRIGYVPQDTYLTDDTIRRNIAFGVPGESVDEGAVQRAVEAAQLAEFVATLPDGLEARVGERGVRLSGGQRQRIGIARALYNDPEVLVMDEATSSLDGQTERYVMEAVESLRLSRTIILVAHRMSTVQKCDMLVLLGDGSISAVGTFDELLEQSARFRAMAGDVRSLSEPAGVDAPACPMVAAP